ncbi:MAG: hypothetical protein RMJ98_16605 [Myxococcales bacterium]|nr:hypothetical protein [Polyangiaceae bacterium]MDW8250917.1 hypothetical protein [Myxococcales bacterium]
MYITFHHHHERLAICTADQIQLRDAEANLLRASPISNGKWLASCDTSVAVLCGKASYACASLQDASISLFTWNLEPLSKIDVDEVDCRGLSLSADGKRLVVTNWERCQVTVFDTSTGRVIAMAGESIPSGASLSPDGTIAVAGTADQGTGALLLFRVDLAEGGQMPMEKLPPPKSQVGLDDAPYFSVFSPDGKKVAISNESWGGRGVFFYDIETRQNLWCIELESSAEEPEAWSPPRLAFAENGRLLLVEVPGKIRAYRTSDGAPQEDLPSPGVPLAGFAVDDVRRRVWFPGDPPPHLPFPPAWSNSHTIYNSLASGPGFPHKVGEAPAVYQPLELVFILQLFKTHQARRPPRCQSGTIFPADDCILERVDHSDHNPLRQPVGEAKPGYRWSQAV